MIYIITFNTLKFVAFNKSCSFMYYAFNHCLSRHMKLLHKIKWLTGTKHNISDLKPKDVDKLLIIID